MFLHDYKVYMQKSEDLPVVDPTIIDLSVGFPYL